MKNLKSFVKSTEAKVAGATAVAASQVGMAFATTGKSATDMIQGVMNMIFGIVQVGGIMLLIVGIVQLVRCFIAVTGGDQLQPGQLGKAAGMVFAGVIALILKGTITTLTGVNPDNIKI